MNNTRWSCSTPSKVIQLPDVKNERNVCLCSYSTTSCEYYELAFTSFADAAATSNEYENDYRKFLIDPLSLTSLFSFILVDSLGVETVIYSDTTSTDVYGEISEQGFNASQPFQVGIKIDWWKVANLLGYGDYTIKTSQTDFGNETTNETHIFRVVKFDPQRANGTVKVVVDNVGVTMNGRNWTGLYSDANPYSNMIRLKGRLVTIDPEVEIESIEDGSRKDIPIQTKITDVYTLNINHVPYDIGASLIGEDIVMNWNVTDYNIFNEDIRDKELIFQGSKVKNTPDYNRKSYELTGKSNISKLNRKFV